MVAQNLVPNPDFETMNGCPNGPSGILNGHAPPWVDGNAGTSDYFHVCSDHPYSTSPNNVHGFQWPLSGDAYTGFVLKADFPPNDGHEYMQAPLLGPLIAGQTYEVAFYVSLANPFCGIEKIGALFTALPPPYPPGDPDMYLDYQPQVESQSGFLSDTSGWMLIYGCFVAEGGEAYITIGNFQPNAATPEDPACNTNYNIVYYFLEDVSVVAVEPAFFEIELEGPVEACGFYEIDPGYPDAHITWSDGSHGPTLIVTESGTYSVTIAEDCFFAEDEIEVTILNTEPVDIEPEELTICQNEIYSISLDPDAGSYIWSDGSTTSEIEISSPGIYGVTLDDGCNISSDEITVQVLAPPNPVDLGPDQFICEDDAFTLSVQQDEGDIIWHDNSNAADYIVTMPGTYVVTISNSCGTETDAIVFTGLATPEIDLPDDVPNLCVGSIYDISIDPGLGDILWQDGSTDSYYVITESGTYSVSVTNQCGTGSDVMNLQFHEPPSFSFGSDTSLCQGDSVVLGGFPLTGDYLWQDGSSSTSFHVNTSGTYALTVTNKCDSDSDTILITLIQDVVQPMLGADVSICPGDSLVLFVNDLNALFHWQDGSTNDSLLVTDAGEYHITASNGCSQASDTILVAENAMPPDVTLPNDMLLCQGHSVTLDAGVIGVSYLWSDQSTGSSIHITDAGIYSVTVSNSCGTDTDSITITDGGPAPLVDLGIDIYLCAGDTVALEPIFSNVDSWIWSNGETGSTLSITSAGETSVTVTNSCGTSYDTITTTLLPVIPSFNLGNDTAVCANETVVLSVNVPDVNITWSNGSTDQTINASDAGQYYATITNTCGQFADTINIAQLPAIPPLDLGNDQSLCPGELIVIDPGIAGVDYLWHDGSTGPTFSTTQATTISLTISNACGSASDQLQVIESTEGPQVDLGDDIIGCEGEEIIIQSGISGVAYLWQDGSTLPAFTTSASGQYILNVSNNCGADADTIEVDLSGISPVVNLGADTVLCDDASMVLSVSVAPDVLLTWQDGSSTPSFEVNNEGSYYVLAANDCGKAADTIVVDYAFSPHPFSLGADTVLCEGESFVLSAPNTTDVLQWQDGSSGSTFLADQDQLYSLQISNQCGTVADEIQITLIDQSLAIGLDSIFEICPPQAISIDAMQPFPVTYQWSTGETSPRITITSPGHYTITIHTNCATAFDSFDVIRDDSCSSKTTYFIPNIFSPNGDGISDVFTVQFNAGAEVIGMTGAIFDRWGNLLFASNLNPFTWDGTRNGELMNPGVYVYKIELTYYNGVDFRTENLTGDLTLVR